MPDRITIDDIAQATGISPRRGEIRMTCPICEGNNPTALSIRQLGDRAVAHCFKAEHPSGELIAAVVGRGPLELRPIQSYRPRVIAQPGPLPLNIGRWWHYFKANGKPAFSVQRIDLPTGKTFRQWTPSNEPGTWYPRGPRGKRPMYRLPSILNSDGPVYIPEGEKCADAVATALNVESTTFAGGANNWRNTDWTPIAGRKVVLIADPDDAGRAAMRGLAGHLHNLGCMVQTAFPDDGAGDVADWFESGGSDVVARQLDMLLSIFQPTPVEMAAWFEQALADGHTQGAPPASECKHTGALVKPKNLNKGACRFFKLPNRAQGYKCQFPVWRRGFDFMGKPWVAPRPCEKCDGCKAHAIKGKVMRWDFARTDLQTTVHVTGAAGADEARRLTGALSNTIRGLPDRSSQISESGEILLTFIDAIPYDLVERIERFFMAPRRNAKRTALPCTIKTEVVTGQDLARFAGGERTAQGEMRHVAWRLHGDFPTPTPEDDFAFGPGSPLGEDDPIPTEPEISEHVRHSRGWRRGKNLFPELRDRRRLAARALQAQAWCEGQTLITYLGPPKLLKQYAEFREGKRPHEKAWEYVAVMLGDDIQAMLM